MIRVIAHDPTTGGAIHIPSGKPTVRGIVKDLENGRLSSSGIGDQEDTPDSCSDE